MKKLMWSGWAGLAVVLGIKWMGTRRSRVNEPYFMCRSPHDRLRRCERPWFHYGPHQCGGFKWRQ